MISYAMQIANNTGNRSVGWIDVSSVSNRLVPFPSTHTRYTETRDSNVEVLEGWKRHEPVLHIMFLGSAGSGTGNDSTLLK